MCVRHLEEVEDLNWLKDSLRHSWTWTDRSAPSLMSVVDDIGPSLKPNLLYRTEEGR